jgi:SAM-dependent methyltransferase
MPVITDLPNPDLLSRTPLSARAILDVGCGTGALGHAYRRLNPAAQLFGIDKDPQAASVAAERYDQMFCGDVEREMLPFGAQRFDTLIYGDVLEHLQDPFTVLAKQAEQLERAGTVVICIPNVEHWSFAARLLLGNWQYEESGLFDETHLRWFTAASMKRGLESIGLVPIDVHPRVFQREQIAAFVQKLRPALDELGVAVEEYANRAAPLQYVWRAAKQARPRITVSATMLAPVGGVSDLRIIEPQLAIATEPYVTSIISEPGRVVEGSANGAGIVVLHRPVLRGAEGLQGIGRLVRDGWVVVTEFDDHPDHFEAMRGEDVLSFAGVHAVQTSTEAMAAVLRERHPEVKVFPNAIRALPEIKNFQNPERTAVFFGALNRRWDWEPIMPALNSLAAMCGDRLHFSVVHDEAFFNALTTPHKRFTPTCDYAAYMDLLGQCEISLMPLQDNEFNRAKSDLKFIEAGACRVAAVASPTVYGEVIEDGHTGLIFEHPDELRLRLFRLISVPDDARALGDAARDYVERNRMLAYQVKDRLDWYQSLWDRRAALTAGVRYRVPQLAYEGVGV